jgi:hypothetical protein
MGMYQFTTWACTSSPSGRVNTKFARKKPDVGDVLILPHHCPRIQVRNLEPQGFGAIQPFTLGQVVLAGLERNIIGVQATLSGATFEALEGQFDFEQGIIASIQVGS